MALSTRDWPTYLSSFTDQKFLTLVATAEANVSADLELLSTPRTVRQAVQVACSATLRGTEPYFDELSDAVRIPQSI